ncbi:Ribokinase-like protein [Mycena floridula]|nr:Ribokinase-like protein [Mycena floridula]
MTQESRATSSGSTTSLVSRRILSIQSHVAYGYVGGKAATFPLQCLGWDVDVVNTVNFSNHAGYADSGGTKANASELTAIFDAMERNELLRMDRVITGYTPTAAALTAIAQLISKLRKDRKGILYLLDPVIGDAGRLYVSPDVVPVYRTMLPLADIITPNWFEVETLTTTPLTSIAALRHALTVLHTEFRVPHVVITSIPVNGWLRASLRHHYTKEDEDTEYLLCICSSLNPSSDNAMPTALSTVHFHRVPLIPGYFSGVGDLFAALLLGHFEHDDPDTSGSATTPLSRATSHALTKTHALLALTYNFAMGLPEEERVPSDSEGAEDQNENEIQQLQRTRRMRGRELRLIQGQDIIRGTREVTNREMRLWKDFWTME